MNHIYKTIWNTTLGAWTAVQETAKACGKKTGSTRSGRSHAGESNRSILSGLMLKAALLPITMVAALATGTAQARPGIYINDGTDAGCQGTSDHNTQGGMFAIMPGAGGWDVSSNLTGAGSLQVPYLNGNSTATNRLAYFGITDAGVYNPCVSSGGSGSENKDTQTNRTLFYGDHVGGYAIGETDNGSKNLTLGGRLDVNSGIIGVGDRGTNGTGATNSIRMGTGTTLSDDNKKENAISIGVDAGASVGYSIAIGTGATANHTSSTVVQLAPEEGGTIAIGTGTKATSTRATAVGERAEAEGAQSVAYGSKAFATGDQSVAVGADTRAAGNSSIAIGGDDLDLVASTTRHPRNVAGTNADLNDKPAAQTYKNLTGDDLVDYTNSGANRYAATASGEGAVAVGVQAAAADLSTAFGTRAKASGVISTALGVGASASKDGSVALGAGSNTETNAVSVTSATVNGISYSGFAGTASAAGNQVSVGFAGNERQLKNVAAGQISATSTDAINGSQLYMTQQAVGNVAKSVAANFGGSVAVNPDGTLTAPSYTVAGNTYNNVGDALNAAAAAGGGGHFYSVNNTNSTAGNYSNDGATGSNALAAGVASTAVGDNAVAVGANSSAAANAAVAAGLQAQASGISAVAVGHGTQATGLYDVAIGRNAMNGATSTGSGSNVAIGDGALRNSAKTDNNSAIGTSAGNGISGSHNVMFGAYANSTNAMSDAGLTGGVVADNTVAVGSRALAGSLGAVAMGNRAHATGRLSAAVGTSAKASGNYAIAQGYAAEASGVSSIAIGAAQSTTSATRANSNFATAIGYGASAFNTGANAIGKSATAAGEDAIAIGTGAQTTGMHEIAIGYNAMSGATIKNTGGARRNIAIGDSALSNSVLEGNNIAVGTQAGQNIDGLQNVMLGALANSAEAAGGATVTANNTVAIGTRTLATAHEAVSVGYLAKAAGEAAVAIGSKAEANGTDSISIGRGNIVNADGAGAIGDPSIVDGTNSFSVGNNNAISNTANNSFVFGGKNSLGGTATRDASGVIDNSQPVTAAGSANNSVVLGNQNSVQSDNVMVMGNNVTIGQGVAGAVAVGNNAAVTTAGSVALGEGAAAGAVNTTAAGGNYTYAGANDANVAGTGADVAGVVSVGAAGATRQIQNVAAGVVSATSTDAINGSQLYYTNAALNTLGTTTASALGGASVYNAGTGVAAGLSVGGTTYTTVQDALNAVNAAAGSGVHYYSVDSTQQGAGSNYNNDGASGLNALAAGVRSRATGGQAVAMGVDAIVDGDNALAVGDNVQATAEGATAVGNNARATALNAQAFGRSSTASGENSAAIGRFATASGSRASAFGIGNVASGESSFAGGDRSTAAGKSSLAIGTEAAASVQDSTAIGTNSSATHQSALAIGSAATAHNTNAVAVGGRAQATGITSAAFGTAAKALADNATALGAEAEADAVNALAAGVHAKAQNNSAVALGNQAAASGSAAVALGRDSVASATNALAFGLSAQATQANSVAIGTTASAAGANGTAIGHQASSTGASMAIGYQANAAGNTGSIAIGNTAQSTGMGTALGYHAQATGGSSPVAVGTESSATGRSAVAMGDWATASGNRAIAIGSQVSGAHAAGSSTYASGDDSVALGTLAQATQANGVALGSSSVADVAAGKVGSDPLSAVTNKANPAWTATHSAVSVGNAANGITRQITSVAAGTEDTDAVNVAQLKTVADAVATTPLVVADGTTPAGVPAGQVVAPSPADAGKLATAGDIANAINNSGFTLTAQGANGSLVNAGETVDLNNTDGNIVISKTAAGNNVTFGLANSITVGPAAGGNPITINGNTGTISGLTSSLPVTTNGNPAGTPVGNTTGQAAPANPAVVSGNAATVGDILNAGWNVQTNGAATDFVRAYDTVNFANGVGTTVTSETDGTTTTFKVNVDAQGMAENAQLPVVYTNAAGDKLYLVDDPANPGTKIFNTAQDGTGTTVAPTDVIASMQNADGTATTPTKLANVAPGTANTDAVNVSQLKDTVGALGGGAGVNPDGTFKVPSYTVTKTDGTSYPAATNVGDALKNLNDEVIKPLTFAGDSGTNVERKLGSTVNIKGGAAAGAVLTTGNIAVVANGTDTLNVQLASNLTGLGSAQFVDAAGNTAVINAAGTTVTDTAGNTTTTGSNGITVTPAGGGTPVRLTGSGLDNGGNRITNVAAGTNPTDAVNVSQLNAAAAAAANTVSAGSSNVRVTNTPNANNSTNYAVSVAPGAVQYTAGNTAAGGNTPNADQFTPADQVTLVGAGGSTSNGVTVNNVAPAELSTSSKQAVNGSQLYAVGSSTAASLGGTSSFDPATGQVTAGLSVGGTTYTNVQNALNAINTTAGAGWSLQANGGTASHIAPNGAVNVVDGSNTTVSLSGNQLQVNVVNNPTFSGPVTANGGLAVGNNLTVQPGTTVDMGGNRITNVADGQAPTDAVTVQQLQNAQMGNAGQIGALSDRIHQVSRNADGGTASAMAMAGLPQAYLPGKSMIAAGTSSYRGASAVALGLSTISDNGKWILKGTISGNNRGHMGASVGAGFQW